MIEAENGKKAKSRARLGLRKSTMLVIYGPCA
jgi:hypothetical protein